MIRCKLPILLLLASVFTPSDSRALTVEEYNALAEGTRNRALGSIISGTFEYLRNQGASELRLGCIRRFYTQQELEVNGVSEAVIPGAQALFREIDIANTNGRLDLRVEDLVLGTINAACAGE